MSSNFNMNESSRGVVMSGPRRTMPLSPRTISKLPTEWPSSDEKRKRRSTDYDDERRTKTARETVDDTPLKPANRGRTMANRVTAALLEKIRSNSSGWELKITGLMRFDCLSKLCEALHQNTSTNRLDLEGAAIGDQGCVLIRNLLQKNKMITTLDLTLNQISDTGCFHLAEVLPHSSLTRLFLSDNIIQDKGVLALAKARPKTLEIFLRGNQRVSPSALHLLESDDDVAKRKSVIAHTEEKLSEAMDVDDEPKSLSQGSTNSSEEEYVFVALKPSTSNPPTQKLDDDIPTPVKSEPEENLKEIQRENPAPKCKTSIDFSSAAPAPVPALIQKPEEVVAKVQVEITPVPIPAPAPAPVSAPVVSSLPPTPVAPPTPAVSHKIKEERRKKVPAPIVAVAPAPAVVTVAPKKANQKERRSIAGTFRYDLVRLNIEKSATPAWGPELDGEFQLQWERVLHSFEEQLNREKSRIEGRRSNLAAIGSALRNVRADSDHSDLIVVGPCPAKPPRSPSRSPQKSSQSQPSSEPPIMSLVTNFEAIKAETLRQQELQVVAYSRLNGFDPATLVKLLRCPVQVTIDCHSNEFSGRLTI